MSAWAHPSKTEEDSLGEGTRARQSMTSLKSREELIEGEWSIALSAAQKTISLRMDSWQTACQGRGCCCDIDQDDFSVVRETAFWSGGCGQQTDTRWTLLGLVLLSFGSLQECLRLFLGDVWRFMICNWTGFFFFPQKANLNIPSNHGCIRGTLPYGGV